MPDKPATQSPRIDYIELTVAEIDRSKKFYGQAFGWTFTDYGPDYCEFSDGRMKGGFDATGPATPGGPLVVHQRLDGDRVAVVGDLDEGRRCLPRAREGGERIACRRPAPLIAPL